MKVNLKVLLLFVVLLVVTACTPAPVEQGVQTSGAVVVNPTLFDGLLIALFTAGTVFLFEKFNLDLKQYAIPVALTFSTWLVAIVQEWVIAQPVDMDPWIALGLRVLEALLAGFGALRLFSRQPRTLLPEK